MKMNTQEILKFCLEKGLLVDKEVLNLFKETEDLDSVKFIINKIHSQTNQKIITKKVFDLNKSKLNDLFLEAPEDKKKTLEKLRINLGLSIEISKEVSLEGKDSEKEEIEDELVLVNSPEISSKKLVVGDFVEHFRKRFLKMRNLLQERPELNNLVSINKISRDRQSISIIGMVSSKTITKNKNIIFEIEDLTGKIKVLINKNKGDLCEKAEEIPLDAVIGFKGTGNREIFFANDLVFVDSFLPERKQSEKEEYALFTGDFHIGSRLFLEENFLKFVDYLNGKIPNTPEVEKIKYLFVVGDVVAGAGIYQGQENDLVIEDVEEQYSKAAELFGKIREDIKIIIAPGNHDVMRIMEPQPVLDEKYAWQLYNLKNVVFATNPSRVTIGKTKSFSGFNVLLYHGYSFHYYANNISRLMKEKAAHQPEKLMTYLLMNRHLAPSHSSTLYFPSEDDCLMIDSIPDIFFAGHTHKSGITYYNNILVVSSSTWETKTSFQEKMGNEPDFCKVPMFNLKTRAVKILDFE